MSSEYIGYFKIESKTFYYRAVKIKMDALIEKLEKKLRQWKPDVAEQVRQYVEEIIDLADQDTLDFVRSRVIEQEVLDLLDEPKTW